MTEAVDATIAAASAAITGPGTPDSVQVTQRESGISLWMRSLAGPALCVIIIGIIVILSWGSTWHLWTPATEAIRAHYVGGVGVALALMVGVLVWRLDGSKLGHIDVKMGPASFNMGGGSQ